MRGNEIERKRAAVLDGHSLMYKGNKVFLPFLIFVFLLLNKGLAEVNICRNHLNWIQQTGLKQEKRKRVRDRNMP